MGLKLPVIFLCLLAHCCLALPTVAAPDVVIPTSPILRLENGSHSAPITAMSADSTCRFVATASLDKTARVWEAATGKALTVLRPPIGDGDEGNLLAVAVSPDGSTVACGGATDYGADGAVVFLFGRANSRITRRITSSGRVVRTLAFSQDGKYLAVGTDIGLSVYRSFDGELAGRDNDNSFEAKGVQFAAPDNQGAPLRLVCSSSDAVYLYKFLETADKPLRKIAEVDAPGSDCGGVAFSPDSKKVAISSESDARVIILSGDGLAELEEHVGHDPYSPSAGGSLACVCWSSDGSQIYGAGSTDEGRETSTIYHWKVGANGKAVKIASGAGQIVGLTRSPGGGLLFSAANVPLGTLGAGGECTLYHRQPASRNNADGDLLVSADGCTIAFPVQPGSSTAHFSLKAHSLTVTPADKTDTLKPPITGRPGVKIDIGAVAELNGNSLDLEPDEPCICKAIAPDEQRFVVGTSHSLQCFNQDRDQLWSRALPSQAWKVNVSGQGNVVVAALGDGTVRWFRMTDGAELCAFYPDDDLKRWVAWTPSCDYDASPGGEDLFGWHVNHGLGHAADFFPGSRFHVDHYRPARVAGALEPSRPVEPGPPAPEAAPGPTGVTPEGSSEVTPSPTAPPRVTVLDAPGQVRGTIATCVDSQGKILLTSFDSKLRPRSLLFSQGVYSEIGPLERRAEASTLGFNQKGQFVGVDYDSTRHSHGFIVTNGVRTRLDAAKGLLGTWPSGINNRGQVTGHYFDQSNRSHGFLWSGGAFTTLDMPGATGGTCAVGINDLGQVVGHFNDKTGRHGFVLSHGVYKTLTAPLGPHNTNATGINARGDIVGSYEDGAGRGRGFLLRHGVYTTLDFPTAVHDFLPVSISDNGRVVGYYKDENDQRHGFVMTP